MQSPAESDAKRAVQQIRKQIAGSSDERDDRIAPADREVLIEFDNDLVSDRRSSNRCGWKHHKNTLTHLRDYAIYTDGLAQSLKDNAEGRRGVDTLTAYVHENYDNGYTIQAKLSAIRIFAFALLEGDKLPPRFAKIEPGKYVEGDPAPLLEDLIEYPDLLEMIDSADILRDKALYSVQWDGGLRPQEELWPLQAGQLSIYDDYIIISLPRTNGKTDGRTILMSVGYPYLREWLRQHPAWDDPEVDLDRETDTIEDIPDDVFIWTKKNKNSLLSYGGFGQRFTVAGERVGMSNECSGQHLRRSAASILARQSQIGERDLRHQFDWSRWSDSPNHYISAHGEKQHVNVGKARGHEIEHTEEDPDVSPHPCERCHEWTMRGIDQCVNCGYNVDLEQETLDRVNRPIENPYADDMGLHEKVIKGHVTADDLESVEKVSSDIRSMGEKFFDQLAELKRHAKAVQDRNETNAFGGVGAYASIAAGGLMAAGQRAAAAWGRAKDKGMRMHPDFEHYPDMSPQRKVGLAGALGLLFTPLFISWRMDGTFAELAAGDVTAWIPVLIGLVFAGWLFDRELPDEADALEAME
ncbi:hypothetical protein DJ71_14575 [Halorubrum sp. E3]|nr:hypothetical protein DJ71_14575 [Halorubrum sp. E3]